MENAQVPVRCFLLCSYHVFLSSKNKYVLTWDAQAPAVPLLALPGGTPEGGDVPQTAQTHRAIAWPTVSYQTRTEIAELFLEQRH